MSAFRTVLDHARQSIAVPLLIAALALTFAALGVTNEMLATDLSSSDTDGLAEAGTEDPDGTDPDGTPQEDGAGDAPDDGGGATTAEAVGSTAALTTSSEAGEHDEAGEAGEEAASPRVHAALTGDEDLAPGDDGFGHAVRDRAHEGRLGGQVSRAARGMDTRDDDVEEGAEEDAGRPGLQRTGAPFGEGGTPPGLGGTPPGLGDAGSVSRGESGAD